MGWVGGRAELRGVEKGIKGKRRQKTGVEEWLRTPRAQRRGAGPPCPPQALEEAAGDSVDPGEVTAGEGSPNLVSQAKWVPLF